MEDFQILRDRAKKHITLADHMLTQTYPLLQDPKLLLAVLQNVYVAVTSAMSALLYHDRLFKKIPPFGDSYEAKMSMFKARCTRRYNIDMGYTKLIEDVKEIVDEHKKSPIEFARKDQFVICSDNYNLKTISIDRLKDFIQKAKLFVGDVDRMVSKNEEIFR